MKNNLKYCPFCGNNVYVISYEVNPCFDKLVINCPYCGEFTLCHDIFREKKTCYDVWNTRVPESYTHNIYGKDDADDWSED